VCRVEGHILKVSGLGPTQTEVPPKKGWGKPPVKGGHVIPLVPAII